MTVVRRDAVPETPVGKPAHRPRFGQKPRRARSNSGPGLSLRQIIDQKRSLLAAVESGKLPFP